MQLLHHLSAAVLAVISTHLLLPLLPLPAAHAFPTARDLLPRDWTTTAITATAVDLPNTATAAIQQLMTYFNAGTNQFNGLGWWQAANAYSAIFAYDAASHSTWFRDSVGAKLTALAAMTPSGQTAPGLTNEYNDDSLWYANACLDAYDAYGGAGFVAQAAAIWSHVHTTSQVTGAGTVGAARAAAIPASCDLAGGVYWTTAPAETYVNAIATGLFAQVGARLYAVQRDYAQVAAASDALTWLQARAVDGSGLVAVDGWNASTCARNAALPAFTYNTGVLIAALVAMAAATGNAAYVAEAEGLAAKAMTTAVWTDGKGAITESRGDEGDDSGVGFKAILLRDMMKLYEVTGNQQLKQQMKAFVNVNYNMVYTKARSGNGYDSNWWGPFSHASAPGQFQAVDVLVAGIIVNK